MTDTTDPPIAPPAPPGHRPSTTERVIAQRGIPADASAAPDGPVPYAWLRLLGMALALAVVGVRWPWVLVVILGLVVMIFLHELGHFVMAKRAGMKVTEFFLCFGPKLWSFRRGETEYGIKLIPAGAYVKIIGMHNLDEVPAADEGRTYRQKSFRQRVGVAVAGSTMHFLLALGLIFVSLVAVGQPGGTMDGRTQARKWVVGSVVPGSGAHVAGLRKGDRLVSIAGRHAGTFDDLRSIVGDRQGQTVRVVYERRGVRHVTEATLRPFVDLALGATHYSDNPLNQTWKAVTNTSCCLGIGEAPPPKERLNLVRGLVETPKQFGDILVTTGGALGKFFSPSGISNFFDQLKHSQTTAPAPVATGHAGRHHVSGGGAASGDNRIVSIIGVVQLGSDVGKVSPAGLLGLFALINISIGLINLVPLLPFDGGHVALAVYEKIQERRLHRKRYFTDVSRLIGITYVVVMLLGVLFVTTTYLDIARPLSIK